LHVLLSRPSGQDAVTALVAAGDDPEDDIAGKPLRAKAARSAKGKAKVAKPAFVPLSSTIEMDDGESREKVWLDDVFEIVQNAGKTMESKGEDDHMSIQGIMLSLAFQFCWTKRFTNPTTADDIAKWSEVRKVLSDCIGTITTMKAGSNGLLSGADVTPEHESQKSSSEVLADRFLSLLPSGPSGGGAATTSFDVNAFKKVQPALQDFLTLNAASKPLRRHPAFRSIEDKMCAHFEALSKEALAEVPFLDVASKVADCVGEAMSPVWLAMAKGLASVVSSKGMPPECTSIFATADVLEEFVCRRQKYVLSALVVLCENVLGSVTSFSKISAAMVKQSSDITPENFLKLEKAVDDTKPGSVATMWRDIMLNCSQSSDLRKAIGKILASSTSTASAPTSQAAGNIPEATAADGSAAPMKLTYFSEVSDLNSFVGGSDLSAEVLAVASSHAHAAAASENEQDQVPLHELPTGHPLSLIVLRRICLKLESFLYGLLADCKVPVLTDILEQEKRMYIDKDDFDHNLQLPYAGPVGIDSGSSKQSFLMCHVQATMDCGTVTVPIHLCNDGAKLIGGKCMVPAWSTRSVPKPNMIIKSKVYSVDIGSEINASGKHMLKVKVPTLVPGDGLRKAIADSAAASSASSAKIELTAPLIGVGGSTARRVGKNDATLAPLSLNSFGPAACIQQRKLEFEDGANTAPQKTKNKRASPSSELAHLLA
jgi:hypothetical protein